VTYEDLEFLNDPKFYKEFDLSSSESSSESEDSHASEKTKEQESSQMILAVRAPSGSAIEFKGP
jgi:hypothetical protein